MNLLIACYGYGDSEKLYLIHLDLMFSVQVQNFYKYYLLFVIATDKIVHCIRVYPRLTMNKQFNN